MRKLTVFNSVSVDGYFVDSHGDMSWAHLGMADPEFASFTAENAKGGGEFVFGRVTYEMMANFWPTDFAYQTNPVVAETMNSSPKFVFSRTMEKAEWNNTTLLSGNLNDEVSKLKSQDGSDLLIFGSGSLVSQLASTDLIDQYQIVLIPVVLGSGRTLFEDVPEKLPLKLISSRSFQKGNVFLTYEPAK